MRALVLSGGGCKGAFQVGALKHLIKELGFSYDILCGTSVGALNCSFLSLYTKENDLNGLDSLTNFWMQVDNKQIFKRHFPFGKLHALWMNSIYNSQPLIDLMHKSIDINKVRASGKKISVGAVSLTNGNYRSFTQDDDCFVDGVLASSSFPSAFKPIEIDGELYSDGGIKHITSLGEAIKLGATEVDLIICSPEHSTAIFDKKSATLTVALRSVDLMTDEIIDADLKKAQLYNQLALSNLEYNKRYVKINIIRPDVDLIEDSLSFNQVDIRRMMSIGYDQAKKVIT